MYFLSVLPHQAQMQLWLSLCLCEIACVWVSVLHSGAKTNVLQAEPHMCCFRQNYKRDRARRGHRSVVERIKTQPDTGSTQTL